MGGGARDILGLLDQIGACWGRKGCGVLCWTAHGIMLSRTTFDLPSAHGIELIGPMIFCLVAVALDWKEGHVLPLAEGPVHWGPRHVECKSVRIASCVSRRQASPPVAFVPMSILNRRKCMQPLSPEFAITTSAFPCSLGYTCTTPRQPQASACPNSLRGTILGRSPNRSFMYLSQLPVRSSVPIPRQLVHPDTPPFTCPCLTSGYSIM